MSPYASAKCGADRLVYSYWATYQIPAVIVRPFNQYGPRQHLEKVVPRFITSCLLNEPLTVHGDGGAARDFIYVSDTCNALDVLAHCDVNKVAGEVFNIGTGRHLSVKEIAEAVVARMGRSRDLITYTGDRPGQVFRHTACGAKFERVLGWKPTIEFEQGLDMTIDWYKQNSSFWKKQLWMRDTPIVNRKPVRLAA
jgi:dTDP-glucose 4,6-dehydratase